ncbi:MAG: hypothetical protein OEY81_06345 [Candidatus Bathyarchaeota archaeon]|nr:hypothetical protein [Candidatus Bathyarchaeota archaeon]
MKRFVSVPGAHGNYTIEIDGSAGQDVKLLESQRNVVSMPGAARYRHLPTTPEDEDEIERGKRLLEIFYPKGPAELTVGDLSVVAAERKKREKALKHDVSEECGLDQLYVGPKPSDVHWPSDVEKESQKIDRLRLAYHRKIADRRFRINNPSEGEKQIPEILKGIKTLIGSPKK